MGKYEKALEVRQELNKRLYTEGQMTLELYEGMVRANIALYRKWKEEEQKEEGEVNE
jgi:hypothetical protein